MERRAMEIGTIESRIHAIVHQVLGERIPRADIGPDRHLVVDLGAESTEVLEIFLGVMMEFNIEIEQTSVVELANLGALCQYVHGKARPCSSSNGHGDGP